jgi:hypothetical protein
MIRIALDAPVRNVSEEIIRRGIAADARVRVVVEVVEPHDAEVSMSELAQRGGAFEWLRDEPDLYTDSDLVRSRGE